MRRPGTHPPPTLVSVKQLGFRRQAPTLPFPEAPAPRETLSQGGRVGLCQHRRVCDPWLSSQKSQSVAGTCHLPAGNLVWVFRFSLARVGLVMPTSWGFVMTKNVIMYKEAHAGTQKCSLNPPPHMLTTIKLWRKMGKKGRLQGPQGRG